MSALRALGLPLFFVVGCSSPVPPIDAAPVRDDGRDDAAVRDAGTDAREHADAGLAACSPGHAIVLGPGAVDVAGGSSPLYPSPTRLEAVGTTPPDTLAPGGPGAYAAFSLVEPDSGDVLTTTGTRLARIDASGRVVWSMPTPGPEWDVRSLQLDVTTGQLLLASSNGDLFLVDVASGRVVSSVSLPDVVRPVLTPQGRIVATTSTGPCEAVVLDGTTVRARLPIGGTCAVVAADCEHAFVLTHVTLSGPWDLVLLRLSDATIASRIHLGDVELGQARVTAQGLVFMTGSHDASGATALRFDRLAGDGTLTTIGWVQGPAPTLEPTFVVDASGTIFVRMEGAVARLDASGAVTRTTFTPDFDPWSTLLRTSDGDLLVTTRTGSGATTLHFLSADTLYEPRTMTFPFELCGPPTVGSNGAYVPACDGSMRVLGASF
jgi:hypothetical protein